MDERLQQLGTTPLRLVARSGRHCHVYVFPAREYVKIGIAVDPKDRWSTIRTANPLLEVPLYVSERLKHARLVEKAAHQALAAYRIDGSEWFRCNRFLAVEVVIQTVERINSNVENT